MTKQRIFFTGGSGKAGNHVIPYLLDQGHKVLNVDLVPLDYPGADNLVADITDSGQMFNAMTSYTGFDELEPGNGVPKFDAVVHFAAVPRILINYQTQSFYVALVIRNSLTIIFQQFHIRIRLKILCQFSQNISISTRGSNDSIYLVYMLCECTMNRHGINDRNFMMEIFRI